MASGPGPADDTAARLALVREMFEAYARGDYEASLRCYHPEVVADASLRPDGRTYHGREGVREMMGSWVGAFEDYKLELLDVEAVGEMVVGSLREYGRGKGSGVEVDQPVYPVFGFRDGLVSSWKGFLDRDQALDFARHDR